MIDLLSNGAVRFRLVFHKFPSTGLSLPSPFLQIYPQPTGDLLEEAPCITNQIEDATIRIHAITL